MALVSLRPDAFGTNLWSGGGRSPAPPPLACDEKDGRLGGINDLDVDGYQHQSGNFALSPIPLQCELEWDGRDGASLLGRRPHAGPEFLVILAPDFGCPGAVRERHSGLLYSLRGPTRHANAIVDGDAHPTGPGAIPREFPRELGGRGPPWVSPTSAAVFVREVAG